MGTPDFAVESLAKIYDSGHNIVAVVLTVQAIEFPIWVIHLDHKFEIVK